MNRKYLQKLKELKSDIDTASHGELNFIQSLTPVYTWDRSRRFRLKERREHMHKVIDILLGKYDTDDGTES